MEREKALTPEGDRGGKPKRADARRNRAAILAAAEAVFAEQGTCAPAEKVAERAGVAIGTVFRHFPTKDALLKATTEGVAARLASEAAVLGSEADPATALFAFFTQVVQQAAAKKTLTGVLVEPATGVHAPIPATLRQEVEVLLTSAKQTGAARPEVGGREVMAMLAATSDAARRAGWDSGLQQRALAIVFDGLRAPSPRRRFRRRA